MEDDFDKHIDSVLNFSLVRVVYEWALGKDFIDVCQFTDAQEGSIVRTILRLENLLRAVKSSAKLIGNMQLHYKVEKCCESIKRDIVFAQSLYLDN